MLSIMREAAKSAYLNALRPLDNETAVRLDYLRALGKLPNLTAPCTFTEKVQHYKLYECDPRMPRLVDKLAGLHKALLSNSQNAELLLAQGLAEIARAAAPKG